MRIWCKNCDEEPLMKREPYDDKHDLYYCPICGCTVEVEKRLDEKASEK